MRTRGKEPARSWGDGRGSLDSRRGTPPLMPLAGCTPQTLLALGKNSRGRRSPSPTLPCSPLRAAGLFVLTGGPSDRSSSPASSPLPAPSSLHIPASRGRSHVRYGQLRGGLPPSPDHRGAGPLAKALDADWLKFEIGGSFSCFYWLFSALNCSFNCPSGSLAEL